MEKDVDLSSLFLLSVSDLSALVQHSGLDDCSDVLEWRYIASFAWVREDVSLFFFFFNIYHSCYAGLGCTLLLAEMSSFVKKENVPVFLKSRSAIERDVKDKQVYLSKNFVCESFSRTSGGGGG